MIAALKIFRGAKSSKQVYPEIEAILQEKKSQEDVQQVKMKISYVSLPESLYSVCVKRLSLAPMHSEVKLNSSKFKLKLHLHFLFQMSIFSLMCNSALRFPLVIAIVMHLSQQLSGINCVSCEHYYLKFL